MKTKELFFLTGLLILFLPSSYSYDFCSDKICGISETSISCPTDCPKAGADRVCNPESEGICDPDCLQIDPDCKKTFIEAGIDKDELSVNTIDQGLFKRGALFVLLLLMIGLFIVIIVRKIKSGSSKENKKNSSSQYRPYYENSNNSNYQQNQENDPNSYWRQNR